MDELEARVADIVLGPEPEDAADEQAVDVELVDLAPDHEEGGEEPAPAAQKSDLTAKEPERRPEVQPDGAMWTSEEMSLISSCEVERHALSRDVEQFHQYIDMVQQIADPNARAQHEQNILAARLDLERRNDALNRALSGLRKTYEDRTKAGMERARSDEAKKLSAVFPSLDIAQTRGYGLTYGFSEAELDGLVDHRMVVILEKARRYDEAEKQKKPVVIKPTTQIKQQKEKPVTKELTRSERHQQIENKLDRMFAPRAAPTKPLITKPSKLDARGRPKQKPGMHSY